jgi:hypothetical protein
MQLSDFSGFLKTDFTPSVQDPDGMSCMSLNVTELAPRMSPDEDPYGWDAEMEKRVQPAIAGDYCPVLQCHPAVAAKRTLLQRVLSLSPRDPTRSSGML